MASSLKDDCIDQVLRELEHGVSEPDIEKTQFENDQSEAEDNLEIESDTTVDDTDADPNFYPSSEEEDTRRIVLFPNIHRSSLNRVEQPTQSSSVSLERGGNDFNLPHTSKNVIIGFPTAGSDSNSNDLLHNEVSNVQTDTIMSIEIDDSDINDPNYQASNGDSSSDTNSDVEVDPEEVTQIIRDSSSQIVINTDEEQVNLPNFRHHKNLVIPKTRNLRGKNGHIWSSKPKTRFSRTNQRNIVNFRQRPVNKAKDIQTPLDAFNIFISSSIVDKIVLHTNVEIEQRRLKYSKTNKATVMPTTSKEINALLGLLVMSAAMKDNHLSTQELFDPSFSGTRYVSVMSRNRFDFLLNCIRFDDKSTRPARKLVDKLAPIREVWEEFVQSCLDNYIPGSYVTIDEQLLGFRGRCPFRMYLPSKPNKYGIKIVILCDVKTKYMINAMPYLGKNTNTSGLPLASYFVKALTECIHGSNRNVTMDNWFTSVSLAKDMLKNHKLTIVGTMRSDKREIPSELSEKKDRKVSSSMFCFDNELVLVSYKAKENKMVYLLSSCHESPSISNTSGKPDIIEFYNSTKGAVDTFDEMSSTMSCSRKTQRWPLCYFYGMLNTTLVNGYVLYVSMMVSQNKKPLNRRDFAKVISEELMKPWLQERIQIVTLPRHLKVKISEIVGHEAVANEPLLGQRHEPVDNEPPLRLDGDAPPGLANDAMAQGDAPPAPAVDRRKRKICSICPSKKRRMTQYVCFKCQRHMCLEHQAKLCVDCVSK